MKVIVFTLAGICVVALLILAANAAYKTLDECTKQYVSQTFWKYVAPTLFGMLVGLLYAGFQYYSTSVQIL